MIAAGLLTQLIGAACLVLGLASLPVVHDLKGGMTGVAASIVAALAAIVCGTLVWRGRLVPLALAAGLDVGFGIGLARGGAAVSSVLRMLPASDLHTAETVVMVGAITMFVAAILCVLGVPSALKLRQWARNEIAASQIMPAVAPPSGYTDVDEVAPTRERPSLRMERPSQRVSQMPLPPPPMPTPMPTAIYEPPPVTPPALTTTASQKLMPTQVIHIGPYRRGGKPVLIIGVAVTVIAIGTIVLTAARGGKASAPTSNDASSPAAHGTATAAVLDASVAADPMTDAVLAAPAAPPPLDPVLDKLHAALSTANAADLAALLDAKAFAIGADSNDLAEGRDAVVEQLRGDVNAGSLTVRFSLTGEDADTAWLAEELDIGGTKLTLTAGLALHDNAWTIDALHVAVPVPNATAYQLAREDDQSQPDVIPDTKDASDLADATRRAFASKPSFVEARSTRPDAFNFGSAPGERLKGGETIKKVFSRINASIKLHDAVKVGPLGANGGWSVANVDFTEALRDGDVTQTFRVLAIWLKNDAGWRMVLTQFSNAR